jgi:putrescine aminotransferase
VVLHSVIAMSRQEPHPGVAKYARHVNPAFIKLLGLFRYGRVFSRARDVWVWDHEGRQYLDALACYGAANIGHNHPRLVESLRAHLLGEHLNLVHAGPSMYEAELAARLVQLAGREFEVAIVGNTGAQAVEEGMKLARAYTGRAGFLYCEGSYHGSSLGTLSIMGDARMRRSFEPLLTECRAVPFGDVEALEQALDARNVAALVLDPGLSESGVMVAPAGYLRAAKQLCARHGTLLLLDEVQTGLGRTGALFAFEHDGVVPDILALAKSLSGGLVPVGATLTRADIARASCGSSDNFDAHFSTFGGNALACAAALETLAIIEDEELVENSRARGAEIRAGLQSRLAGHPLVREVRGRGLFIAVELGPEHADWRERLRPALLARASSTIFGQWAALKLLERGVICQPATHRWNVLKLMPPLTLSREHTQTLVDAVVGVLGEYRGVSRLMRDMSERLGRQFLAGWSF